MKKASQILLLSLVASTAWFCGTRNDNQATRENEQNGNSAPVSMREAVDPNMEGEVLALVAQVDKNEIAAAKEAENEKMSQAAIDYAKMLREAHDNNLEMTKKISRDINIDLNKTSEVDMLEDKGDALMNKLKQLDGKQFEMAYIDAMIQGHTEALNMIDNKLMKNAKNDMVISHLTETRKHVAMHLDEAKRLKNNM